MESKFTGGLLGLIGVNLLTTFLISITVGIATPWAVCYRENWFADHTVIDGRQMRFDGTGGELFGKYIIWFLLTIVTCGIYSFWLGIKMRAWIVSHTHFE